MLPGEYAFCAETTACAKALRQDVLASLRNGEEASAASGVHYGENH